MRVLSLTATLLAATLLVFALPRAPITRTAIAATASASAPDKYAGLSTVAPNTIENPGYPAAYFYKPRSGRKMKPVLVYLHGRDGNPEEGCRQWAKVATEFGWLLCPSGQEARAGGGRGWANDPFNSQKNVTGALEQLRMKFGRK